MSRSRSQDSSQASEASRVQMDQRLGPAPGFIAAGIKPETIAAEINESLEQQFSKSTIPETADALAVTAAQMKKAALNSALSHSTLGNTYRRSSGGSPASDRKWTRPLSRAANTANRAAKRSVARFHQEYRWSLFLLTTFALLIGIFARHAAHALAPAALRKTSRASALR